MANTITIRRERRDKSANDNQTSLEHQMCDRAGATDVFMAVGLGKPQIGAQAPAQFVAIEYNGGCATLLQFGKKSLG